MDNRFPHSGTYSGTKLCDDPAKSRIDSETLVPFLLRKVVTPFYSYVVVTRGSHYTPAMVSPITDTSGLCYDDVSKYGPGKEENFNAENKYNPLRRTRARIHACTHAPTHTPRTSPMHAHANTHTKKSMGRESQTDRQTGSQTDRQT